MNTKLTLTIDQSVIEKAKKYAKGKGQSLSDMIENYLKVVTQEKDLPAIQLTPLVKSLKGSFKDPGSSDYQKEIAEELSKKYN